MKQRPIRQNKENPDEKMIKITQKSKKGDIFPSKKKERRWKDIQRILCRRQAKRWRNYPSRASSELCIDRLRTDRLPWPRGIHLSCMLRILRLLPKKTKNKTSFPATLLPEEKTLLYYCLCFGSWCRYFLLPGCCLEMREREMSAKYLTLYIWVLWWSRPFIPSWDPYDPNHLMSVIGHGPLVMIRLLMFVG